MGKNLLENHNFEQSVFLGKYVLIPIQHDVQCIQYLISIYGSGNEGIHTHLR